MATTTMITIPVYQINGLVMDRTLFPYGNQIAMAGAGLIAQPNSFNTLQDLQAGRIPGAALIYSTVRTASNPGPLQANVYYTNLTAAQVLALANA